MLNEVDLRRRKEEKAVEAKGRKKANLEAVQNHEEAILLTMMFTPLPLRVKLIGESLHLERLTNRFAEPGLEGPATRAANVISAILECAGIT